MTEDALCRLSAADMAAGVRAGRLRPRALVEASLARIRRLDGELKAFITVAEAQALAAADEAERRLAAGAEPRLLEGVPLAVKDLTATAGIRTTCGSRVYEDVVPEADDPCVARLRTAGAIVVGKSNTPEFGFGAITSNDLRGATVNPFDPARTCGGSSGGSAVAVATGMVPLAHGTDFGGSVRTPASFCGVVGLRPTPGRIASPNRPLAWDGLATHGILARDAGDAALMLAAMAGPDPRDPTSTGRAAWPIPDLDGADPASLRVAASPDLGIAMIDFAVVDAFEAAVARMDGLFATLDTAHPDCRGAEEAFGTLRAAHIHHAYAPLLEQHRDLLTPTVVWNVERGQALSAADYLRAEAQRSALHRRFAAFFERYDVLMTVSASVPPFPNAQGEVLEINGFRLGSIIEYLTITYTVSLVGFPCLSIPCGRTADGLPIGLQLIARPWEEDTLLRCARMLERRLGFRHEWPVMA